jgi:DNA-binding beta-propeller fold protein YncE
VANSGANTVSFIETGKFTVCATLIVGPTPKAAAVDPASGRFYVPTFEDDRARVVQP